MKEATGSKSIVIPEIYCPFPSQMSPHYDVVKAHTLDWARHFGLAEHEVVPRYSHMADVPGLACRIYPSADLEELCLASDWLCFLRVFDDVFTADELDNPAREMLAFHEHLLSVIQNPPLAIPQGPIPEAFADLFRRSGSSVSSVWRKRFEQHNAANFAAQRWQRANRERQSMPDSQAYFSNCVQRVEALPIFDLIEVVHHAEIPSEIYASQRLQAILRAGNNIIGWTYDVYSFTRDVTYGDVNNVLTVTCREQNISLQEAVDQLCSMIVAEMRRFEEMLHHLPASSVDSNRYIGPLWISIADCIRGHLDWYRGNREHTEQTLHTSTSGFLLASASRTN
jgi:Terpene synthase family 2, C-terminal metal binding